MFAPKKSGRVAAWLCAPLVAVKHLASQQSASSNQPSECSPTTEVFLNIQFKCLFTLTNFVDVSTSFWTYFLGMSLSTAVYYHFVNDP